MALLADRTSALLMAVKEFNCRSDLIVAYSASFARNPETKVSVTVDDVANVVDLSEAAHAAQVSIGVLLDVNVGQNRCGVEPDKSVIELAQTVESAPGLQFLGIHAYNGAIQSVEDDDKRKALDSDSMEKTLAAINHLRSAEIP